MTAATTSPTWSAFPNAVVAASRIFPSTPGIGGDDRVREDRERRVCGKAAVRDRVHDERLEVGRHPERPELVPELSDEPVVDHRAEDRHCEDAAELPAGVHGRGRHPRALGRHDREHRGRHGDQRQAEAEPDHGERNGEPAPRDGR